MSHKQQPETFKIAAIQASSVFLDIEGSVEKACDLIREAPGNLGWEVNHIHTIWRDPGNDFGDDLLRRHYEESSHHPDP